MKKPLPDILPLSEMRERILAETLYEIGTPETDGAPLVTASPAISDGRIRIVVWTPPDMDPALRAVFERDEVAFAWFLAQWLDRHGKPPRRPPPQCARQTLRRLYSAAREVVNGPAFDYLAPLERQAVFSLAVESEIERLQSRPAHRPPATAYMHTLATVVRAFRWPGRPSSRTPAQMTPLATTLILAAAGFPMRGRTLPQFLAVVQDIEPW
jgi:hypothetical protein